MDELFTFHIVPHTHWDREWYLPLERFRFRLAWLVDELLDILESDPAFAHFHFDGQTIVLEDYLEIKPKERARLASHIASGRIAVGPWYVLPDEFLVSGEALLRNLEIGMGQARDFGADPRIGYLPDMFGHVSQMPQILAGLGLGPAFLWRGVSGPPERLKSEFTWRGADGTEILVLHFHDKHGYANGKRIGDLDADGTDLARAAEASARELASLESEMASFATTRRLLVMNGVDHMEPKRALTAVIAELNRKAGREELRITSLEDYARIMEREARPFPVVEGEFRSVDRTEGRRYYDFILAGVLSTRYEIKKENFRVQALLEKWAEPASAIASLLGERHPDEFLLHAWKNLLRNHPHDDICGCSTDETHRNNGSWLLWACQTASQLAEDALRAIARRIAPPTVSCEKAEGRDFEVVVFNPHPWPVSGNVTARLAAPPGLVAKSAVAEGPEGAPAAAVLLGSGAEYLVPNEEGLYPPDAMGEAMVHSVLLRAEGVPGLGYARYVVRLLPEPLRLGGGMANCRGLLDNGLLRVEARPDGSLDVQDRTSGMSYSGLNAFEESADAGNEYVYSRALLDRKTCAAAPASVSIDEDDPLRASMRIVYELQVPESLSADGRSRSELTARCAISTTVSLDAGSRTLEFGTTIDNRARDHRIRVLFPSRLRAERSWADSAFDVVERPMAVVQPSYAEWTEDAPSTFPMQNFACVSDGKAGITLAARGIHEYELVADEDRALALTLLRCVGNLGAGKGNLALSQPSGPDAPTPDAQCLGIHFFSYSATFHAGGWEEAAASALERNHPLRAEETRRFEGIARTRRRPEPCLPPRGGFLALEGKGVFLSSMRRLAGGCLALRLFNPTVAQAPCALRFGAMLPRRAWLGKLSGETGTPLALDGDAIRLSIAPKKIVTLILDIEGPTGGDKEAS